MGTRDRWIILAAALVMLAGLGGAVSLTPRINDERSYLQLTVTDNATKAVAPEYAWTQALGSFKGLFIDMLWIRIEQMKNEGKYHEAMRLSEFITMLQPRFPTVWADRAWNLAYNISVGTHTKAERWMWVRAGIRLLRDEGIPNNPRAVQLYKELAWIYIHKIGQFSDDANWYYKTELARRWHFLLGPHPKAPPTR